MRVIRFLFAAAGLCLIAACSVPGGPDNGGDNRSVPSAEPPDRNVAVPPPAAPAASAAPGTPDGLPDDRKPVAETPFSDKSAQGAADVVQRYFALVEAGKYADARRLWDRGGDASGKTEEDFAADFRNYRGHHAEVGAPGRIEGAAGSSYVEIPVQLYGRLKDGSPFRQKGTVTLRRVNDVPGSTEEQRRWHIADIAAGEAPE